MLRMSKGPRERLKWLRRKMVRKEGKGWSRVGWWVWRKANVEWIDYQWWREGYRLDRVYGWNKED